MNHLVVGVGMFQGTGAGDDDVQGVADLEFAQFSGPIFHAAAVADSICVAWFSSPDDMAVCSTDSFTSMRSSVAPPGATVAPPSSSMSSGLPKAPVISMSGFLAEPGSMATVCSNGPADCGLG